MLRNKTNFTLFAKSIKHIKRDSRADGFENNLLQITHASQMTGTRSEATD